MSNQKALDQYTVLINSIKNKVDELKLLADDNFGTDPESINWAHVGDLSSLKNQLNELLKRFGD